MSDQIRLETMYRKMAESAIDDYEAGHWNGWDGKLAQYQRVACQITALLDAGFVPHMNEAGYTWKVPAGFDASWLYSDRSCGHYSWCPWAAAHECATSATAERAGLEL